MLSPEEYPVEKFTQMVRQAIAQLSPDHVSELKNVAILTADEPSPLQVEKLNLRGDQSLLGLFEGIPRTSRTGYESGVLGDTITIFRLPHLQISADEPSLRAAIKQTVWHEMAHYFGIDHDEMSRRQAHNS